MSKRLSPAEMERYREGGLVIPDYRIPDSLLARMRAAVDDLIERHPHIAPEQLSGPHNPWGQSAQILGTEEFLEFCRHDEFLDMVEDLIGPDIILWGSMLFAKPGGTGKAVPWHQDGQYWPITPLRTVTLRIAIDGSRPENGCMRYIPGSHKDEAVQEHVVRLRDDYAIKQEIPDIDLSLAKDVVLEPGQISLHDVYLIHGSNPNKSGARRADYAVRYMPATALYDRRPDHPATLYSQKVSPTMNYPMRPLWLVRGQDRAGNDFETGKGVTWAERAAAAEPAARAS